MKKFLVLGLTALGLALVTDRPADAWINSKFSVGVNWQWQSGGNSLLWGMFRNSQPPCPDGGGHGPGPGYGGHAPTFPGFTPYGPNDFQWFGNQQQPGGGNAIGGMPGGNPNGNPGSAYPNTAPVTTPATAPAPAPAAASTTQQHAYGSYNPYQAVNYAPSYYGHPNTGSYFPGYYGYYQAPSYWYGR